MHRLNLILLISLFLSSCAHEPSQNTSVLLGERSDLYFTGRGSAAGIMMDAYMGGAGVAIGIAIDEGIAKEIAAGLRPHNPDFSIVKLFEEVLQERTNKDVALSGLIFVKIDKYGFQAAPQRQRYSIDRGRVYLQIRCLTKSEI